MNRFDTAKCSIRASRNFPPSISRWQKLAPCFATLTTQKRSASRSSAATESSRFRLMTSASRPATSSICWMPAVEGCLRSAGVTLGDCEKREDGKGEYFLAVISLAGRPTGQVLQEVLPEAIGKLPWPKSMRWGSGRQARWVRPLHRIVCTFDGEVLDFTFASERSGNETLGHRFMSKRWITVR